MEDARTHVGGGDGRRARRTRGGERERHFSRRAIGDAENSGESARGNRAIAFERDTSGDHHEWTRNRAEGKIGGVRRGAYACVDGKNILVGREEVLAGRGEKPCASIFREACARVGMGPGEAVHVGDSWRADARGALEAGLRAAWISAGRSTPDDGHDAERLRVFTTIDAFFDHVESATGEQDAWCRFEE